MADKENNKKELSETNEDIKKEKPQEPEILDNIPEEAKKMIEMGISMQRFSGAMPNPLLSKINEKHIDRILDISERDDENSFNESSLLEMIWEATSQP